MNRSIKAKRGKSIKSNLTKTFAVLIVVPIIILGAYAYVVSRNNLIEQTRITMIGNAEVISNGIENNVERETDVVTFFSYEAPLKKALEKAKEDPDTFREVLKDEIEPMIWYYLGTDPNIRSITIYSDLVSEDSYGDFFKRPSTDLEKEWYAFSCDEYEVNWMVDGEGGVYVIKAILDQATSSKRIGMVVLQVDKESFFSVVNKSSYLNNGLVILDYNGNVIEHQIIENKALDDTIVEHIRVAGVEGFVEQAPYFIAAADYINNGWRLYYYVDRDKIVADVYRILGSVVIIAGVISVIALILSNKFARSMSGRLSKINYMANEIKSGHFNVQNNDLSEDEIGQLSESVKEMADTLNEMVNEIERMNQEKLMIKENDIHYREWLFDFVVEKNNDILAVINEGSYSPVFLTANAEAVLGLPMEDLKADIRDIAKAQRDNDENRLDDAIFYIMENGGEVALDEIKMENKRTNEHLYYRGVIVCTIDDGGKRIAIALYDRTQEIRRNHQLQEALNAAETANKAKTSFLANMSHDFRTPMNAITGFNLLIDKHADEPEKVKEYTHKISLASSNLLSLLNDVLDMSKIESGKTTLDIKEMAIGLLLEEINSVISFQAKSKNQEYVVKLEDMEHDMFMGDKKRINEILMNILGNAVKYTPEGGRIEFTIKESRSSSEGFNNVTFTISDNGIGMKPEYKDKIFDAFSREEKGATKTIQGTGLGMAITKSLVELMGGTIRVETKEGEGSTFIVNLRLKVVETTQFDFWKAHGIERLLYIDSYQDETDKIYNSLANENLEVIRAKTDSEALSIIDECEEKGKSIDIILVDEMVGDRKAAEVVRLIRSRNMRNNVLIIVMAYDFGGIEDEVRAAGTNDLMQKPFFISTFKQLLEDLSIRAGKDQQEEEKTPIKGMKFLAAEDNDINADILTELMNMEGATVTRAVNGQEVVDMFKAANEGDYDMILMDIQMPVMNGYEAAAAIRALGTDWSQKIPIIAMTANAYADDVQQAFDAGMNAHVTKPIDIRIVEKTIMEFKK
ncbi:MAG: response regulator [Butyrivibrio sp.]|nr:response regulator [Butyrivibrio sp.]